MGEVPRACWLCGRGIWVCVSRDVPLHTSISGLVAEYIVAIDVTRVRFPADANLMRQSCWYGERGVGVVLREGRDCFSRPIGRPARGFRRALLTKEMYHFRGSIVVSISARHAEDPDSIPGRGEF